MVEIHGLTLNAFFSLGKEKLHFGSGSVWALAKVTRCVFDCGYFSISTFNETKSTCYAKEVSGKTEMVNQIYPSACMALRNNNIVSLYC